MRYDNPFKRHVRVRIIHGPYFDRYGYLIKKIGAGSRWWVSINGGGMAAIYESAMVEDGDGSTLAKDMAPKDKPKDQRRGDE